MNLKKYQGEKNNNSNSKIGSGKSIVVSEEIKIALDIALKEDKSQLDDSSNITKKIIL